MLAKMALRLSHTTCEVAVFSGEYWSQVSDLTKFPITNKQAPCKASIQHHGIFFHRWKWLEQVEGFGQMMRGFGKCWHLSQLADKKYQSGWDCGKIKDFFWLPCKFNFCKSPAVKVKSHHHPVDLAQCFL